MAENMKMGKLVFTKVLHGHGPKTTGIKSVWMGMACTTEGVEYFVGPSPSHIVLNLNNQMSFPTNVMRQAFGIMKGSIEDEVIILGNHRDSWGPGVGDSVSGAAALMEVVRASSTAYRNGWRPRRTIVFVSWEGAETGQVGSEIWITLISPGSRRLPWHI